MNFTYVLGFVVLRNVVKVAGFYHGRACAARDLNSGRWKKEEKGIMSLETTKKSQRFPTKVTLGKK